MEALDTPANAERFADLDPTLWERFHQEQPEQPPSPAFIDAALAIHPDHASWRDIADKGYESAGISGRKAFMRWLGSGLADHPRGRDPAGLQLRLDFQFEQVDFDGIDRLLQDFEQVDAGSVQHARALLLGARRWHERRDLEQLRRCTERALAIADALGDAYLIHQARMHHAASQLAHEQFRSALDTIEAELPRPSPTALVDYVRRFRSRSIQLGGTSRATRFDDPRADAIADFSARLFGMLPMGIDSTALWALGGMAERYSDASLGDTSHGAALWVRFERWLGWIVDGMPSALEHATEVASQRGYRDVVARIERAEALASEPPLVRALHHWVDQLIATEQLVLEDSDVDRGAIVDSVVEILESASDAEEMAAQVAEALFDAPGVDDLYLDDEALMASLRAALR